jgi:hypothetical protein
LEDATPIKYDTETFEVKKEDGTPLEDGEYTLDDATKFTVKDGKRVEEVAQDQLDEVPTETKTEDLADAPTDSSTSGTVSLTMTLEDGTVIFVDENNMIRYQESNDILLDGDYTLDDASVITIKDGLLVDAELANKEKELNKLKEEFSSVKVNFEKELNEVKLQNVSLQEKITELETRLSSEPATSKTAINDVKEEDLSKMTYAERTAYQIKKQLKNKK